MFADKGSLHIETINEKSIKDFIKYNFNKWVAKKELIKLKENYLIELKYFLKNDKTEFHNIDINHLQSEKIQINELLIWELKGIKENITTIKRIFDYLEFDVYDILEKKELLENYNYFNFTATDRKSIEILKNLLNDKTKLKEVNVWSWKYENSIKEIANKSERTTQIYMLILMYLAYNDIESFLTNKIDYSLTIENDKPINNNFNCLICGFKDFSEFFDKNNDNYYQPIVKGWINERKIHKPNNKNQWFDAFLNNLQSYIEKSLIAIKNNYEKINKNEKPLISQFEIKISNQINFFKTIPYAIKLNLESNNIDAIELQQFVLRTFDLCSFFLKEEFCINIENCFIHDILKPIITEIKTSIDYNILPYQINGTKNKIEPTNQKENSLYPFLTQHGKNLFEEYLKTSTDYNDISFIFYQLTESNPPEMVKMKYIEYIDWLKENKYITEKEFINLDKKISLNKKSNAQFRKDRLNEIKSRLKKAE